MQPAEQRHRNVRVPVDESRQHQPPARINGLGALILTLHLASRPHRHNRVALDRDTAIVQNRPRPVHRNHSPAADDQIHILLRLRKHGSIEQHRQHNGPNRHLNCRQFFHLSP